MLKFICDIDFAALRVWNISDLSKNFNLAVQDAFVEEEEKEALNECRGICFR